jgi:hypothetical protein
MNVAKHHSGPATKGSSQRGTLQTAYACKNRKDAALEIRCRHQGLPPPFQVQSQQGSPADKLVIDKIAQARIEHRLPPNRDQGDLRLTPAGGWHRIVRKVKVEIRNHSLAAFAALGLNYRTRYENAISKQGEIPECEFVYLVRSL